MMPQLKAEESIVAANRIALGTGSLSKQDARALQWQWRREAHPVGRTQQPATASSIWGGLAALPGHKVVLVPKKSEPRG